MSPSVASRWSWRRPCPARSSPPGWSGSSSGWWAWLRQCGQRLPSAPAGGSSTWSHRFHRGKSASPARSNRPARDTLRAAGGWLRCRARRRGATFFQPQAEPPNQIPDLRNAQRYARLVEQPRLHFRQCQIGLRAEPSSYLLLRFFAGTQFAAGPVRHALGLPRAPPLRGDLPRPSHADREPRRQLGQRSFATVVSAQQLATQIVRITTSHHRTHGIQPELSILYPKVLQGFLNRGVGANQLLSLDERDGARTKRAQGWADSLQKLPFRIKHRHHLVCS